LKKVTWFNTRRAVRPLPTIWSFAAPRTITTRRSNGLMRSCERSHVQITLGHNMCRSAMKKAALSRVP
jgi:hypothetical protein